MAPPLVVSIFKVARVATMLRWTPGPCTLERGRYSAFNSPADGSLARGGLNDAVRSGIGMFAGDDGLDAGLVPAARFIRRTALE